MPVHDGPVDLNGRGRRHRQLPSMLKVGCIGFGGGSALIPIMERELVSPDGGLTEKAFVQDVVIANVTPGALPVKLAALSGIQLGGAALSAFSALPGTIATVGLLALFSALGPVAIRNLEYVSLGITAFILFLLAHYVATVIVDGGRRRRVYMLIAGTTFLLTGAEKSRALIAHVAGLENSWVLPELSALGVVLVAIGSIGAFSVYQWFRYRPQFGTARRRAQGLLRPVLVAIITFAVVTLGGIGTALLIDPVGGGALLGLVSLSSLSSFGGGEAYVGVADGFFVASGMVDSASFYGQIVPIANALPGPILVKIATGIAYSIGFGGGGFVLGIIFATLAFLVSIGACCVVALGVLAAYDQAQHSLFVQNVAGFILPVICGLLASTSVSMLHSNARISEQAGLSGWIAVLGSIALAGGVALVHRTAKVPDIVLVLLCGGASFALLITL